LESQPDSGCRDASKRPEDCLNGVLQPWRRPGRSCSCKSMVVKFVRRHVTHNVPFRAGHIHVGRVAEVPYGDAHIDLRMGRIAELG
jgi:hypothetical protein